MNAVKIELLQDSFGFNPRHQKIGTVSIMLKLMLWLSKATTFTCKVFAEQIFSLVFSTTKEVNALLISLQSLPTRLLYIAK